MRKYLSVENMNDIHQRLNAIADKCLEFNGGVTYPDTDTIDYNEDPENILNIMQSVDNSIGNMVNSVKGAILLLYGEVPEEINYKIHIWEPKQREKYKIVNAWYIWIELVEELLNKWGFLYDINNEIIVDINGEKILVRSGE